MNPFHQHYYEQSSLWNFDYFNDPTERNRIESIGEIIPKDVKTILDVGCGNGSFLNFLQKTNLYERLVGVDFSEEAIKYVKTEKAKGNVATLSFKDNEFDLVTCLEVLEHLTYQDYQKCILEIQRVSKKYTIITAPNMENLEYSQVICPICYCRFNSCFHLRAFDKNILCDLFKDFKLLQIREIGPDRYHYNPFLLRFRTAKKMPLSKTTIICPQCGYHNNKQEILKSKASGNRLFKGLKPLVKYLIKLFFVSKKKRWLLALYERTSR
jgi:SAM-dependent methyltransferase